MRLTGIRSGLLVWFSACLILTAVATPRATAADMRFAATLVWGTNDPKPPEGKDYKPVQPEIRDKLKDLPLKWANWFEVTNVQFSVPVGPVKEAILGKCQLNVKNLNDSELEVSQIGKNKEVLLRRKQRLLKGESLVLGGNAPNSTSWLVILKRLE